MDESQNMMWGEKMPTPHDVPTVGLYFHEAWEQAKLIYGDWNPNSDCLWRMETVCKEARGNILGDEYVLYLAHGAVFMDIYIYQNS